MVNKIDSLDLNKIKEQEKQRYRQELLEVKEQARMEVLVEQGFLDAVPAQAPTIIPPALHVKTKKEIRREKKEARKQEKAMLATVKARKKILIVEAGDGLSGGGEPVTGLSLRNRVWRNHPETKKEPLLNLKSLSSNAQIWLCAVSPRGRGGVHPALSPELQAIKTQIKACDDILVLEAYLRNPDAKVVGWAEDKMTQRPKRENKTKKVDATLEARIMELHNAGWSNIRIAEELGLTRFQVGTTVGHYGRHGKGRRGPWKNPETPVNKGITVPTSKVTIGIELERRQLIQEEKDFIYKLHSEGVSNKEISKQASLKFNHRISPSQTWAINRVHEHPDTLQHMVKTNRNHMKHQQKLPTGV